MDKPPDKQNMILRLRKHIQLSRYESKEHLVNFLSKVAHVLNSPSKSKAQNAAANEFLQDSPSSFRLLNDVALHSRSLPKPLPSKPAKIKVTSLVKKPFLLCAGDNDNVWKQCRIQSPRLISGPVKEPQEKVSNKIFPMLPTFDLSKNSPKMIRSGVQSPVFRAKLSNHSLSPAKKSLVKPKSCSSFSFLLSPVAPPYQTFITVTKHASTQKPSPRRSALKSRKSLSENCHNNFGTHVVPAEFMLSQLFQNVAIKTNMKNAEKGILKALLKRKYVT